MPRSLASLRLPEAVFLALVLLATGVAPGVPVRADEPVPALLEPWRAWVLAKHPQHGCPWRSGSSGERTCAWLSRARIQVDDDGGRFALDVEIFADGWAGLPGSADLWPRDVSAGTRALAVVPRRGRPSVYLVKGTHEISGRWTWAKRPASLPLPPEVGLLELRIGDRAVASPALDERGELWFERREAPEAAQEQDRMTIDVYRRIADGVPLRATTEIRLWVTGRMREVSTGAALPPGFEPIALDSPLPARVEPTGDLRVQVRAGQWTLRIEARALEPGGELRMARHDDVWPSEELWSFQPNLPLRQVELSGAEQVDAQQLALPEDWRSLATYRMIPDAALRITELRRGDTSAAEPRLTVERNLWLDFDGAGFTAADDVYASVPAPGRLEAEAGFALGRADVDGAPLLITARTEGGAPGIALSPGEHRLATVSRVESSGRTLGAAGWSQTVESLGATLHLPPGWTLLHAAGVDRASESWVSRWTLLDLFVVMLTGIGLGRLFGVPVGVLGLAALGASYHGQGTPALLWVNLLLALAVLRVVPAAGRAKPIVTLWCRASLLLVVLLVLAFSVRTLQRVVYPVLDRDRPTVGEITVRAHKAVAEDSADRERVAPETMAPSVLLEAETSLPRMGGVVPERMRPAPPPKAPAARPGGITQTGPGRPDWRWQSVYMEWHGPVAPGQSLRLLLLGPWATRAFLLLQVLGLGALLGWLLHRHGDVAGLPALRGRSSSAVLVLLAILVAPGLARAQGFPGPELLAELEQRLTRAPECAPECASVPAGALAIDGDRVRLSLRVDVAADRVAMPLPARRDAWMPEAVLVDNRPATLARDASGALWIALSSGRHSVALVGAAADEVKLAFALAVHALAVDAPGWIVSGVVPGRATRGTVELRRERPRAGEEKSAAAEASAANAALAPRPEPVFVSVRRSLVLGHDEWRAYTQVRRIAPRGGAIHIGVPLLPGESPAREDLAIENGMAQVRLEAGQESAYWESRLAIASTVDLAAPERTDLVEEWRIDDVTGWHVEAEGIPPVREGEFRQWLWLPWPGESVRVHATRPIAVSGPTVTIEAVEQHFAPGQRVSGGALRVRVLASQGGDLPLEIPEGARLQSWSIDGRAQPLVESGRAVRVPLHPGTQEVALEWQEERGLRLRTTSPAIALPLPATNVSIRVEPPPARWTLALGGPALGPAVLFWGVAAVVVLVSLGLGRVRALPLRTYEWVLLGLGLGLIEIFAPVLVVLWFGALAWRGRAEPPANPRVADFLQVCLYGFTAVVILTVIVAIPYGLLGSPDMRIAGNGSDTQMWRWFQDRTSGELPRVWFLSLPLWVYRLAILAWALWLAFASLRWARWAYAQLTPGGAWRSRKVVG